MSQDVHDDDDNIEDDEVDEDDDDDDLGAPPGDAGDVHLARRTHHGVRT